MYALAFSCALLLNVLDGQAACAAGLGKSAPIGATSPSNGLKGSASGRDAGSGSSRYDGNDEGSSVPKSGQTLRDDDGQASETARPANCRDMDGDGDVDGDREPSPTTRGIELHGDSPGACASARADGGKPSGSADDIRSEQGAALEEVSRGAIQPLEPIYSNVQDAFPGEVLSTHLHKNAAGHWIYIMIVLSNAGRYHKITVDAVRNVILEAH